MAGQIELSSDIPRILPDKHVLNFKVFKRGKLFVHHWKSSFEKNGFSAWASTLNMGLINKGWYGLFVACGIWCLADVSNVSPSFGADCYYSAKWFSNITTAVYIHLPSSYLSVLFVHHIWSIIHMPQYVSGIPNTQPLTVNNPKSFKT